MSVAPPPPGSSPTNGLLVILSVVSLVVGMIHRDPNMGWTVMFLGFCGLWTAVYCISHGIK